MEKATRRQTKHHNSKLILKSIFEADEISRAELARQTGLTRPTVSALVAELIDKQYVVEVGRGPSAGGKRPMLLNLAQDRHNLLCLDLGGRTLRGALLDLRGEIKQRRTVWRGEAQGEAALALVMELVGELLTSAEVPVLGIGIGTPGLVNSVNGTVLNAVNLGWQDLKLRERISEAFGIDVFVANDSHMAALAEYTFGGERDSQNLILIRIGQGVGAGIVVRGQVFFGDGFGAGEIGHVVVANNGELCSCGNRGCLETTSSTRAMLQHAAEIDPTSAESWEALVAAFEQGDNAVDILVRSAASHVGIAVANLIGTFNIHHIVIAGRVVALGERYLQAVEDTTRRRVLPAMAAETDIGFSALGDDIVMLGCAAMILQKELGVI